MSTVNSYTLTALDSRTLAVICCPTDWDLLVGVCKGVLIHRTGPFLILLPEACEVISAFSKALWIFWLLF